MFGCRFTCQDAGKGRLRIFWVWLLPVVVLSLTFLGLGWLLGRVLFYINLDYLVPVQVVATKGMQAGLVLGTFFGACAIVGRSEPASLEIMGKWILVVLASTIIASILGGAGGYLLCKWHFLHLPESTQIGSAKRIFLCRGLLWGGGIGGMTIGSLGGVMMCFRQRVSQQ